VGRPTFFRQRIRTEAASVEAKTLLAFLTSEIRARREISLEEAEMVARDTLDFIEGHLLSRGLGQIELPAIAGRSSFMRRGRSGQPEKLVTITVFSDDDAELMADFGVAVMVLGRMARAIEEAWEQDALLDEKRLCLLWPLSHKGIRERLSKLWDQGCLLPLAGMSRKMRERLTTPRAVLAVDRYLRGDDPATIRRELAVSRHLLSKWYLEFQYAVALSDRPADEIAEAIGEPPEVVAGWLGLWARYRDSQDGARERVPKKGVLPPPKAPPGQEREAFLALLRQRHGYTPASSERFCQEISDLAYRISRRHRASGQVVYFGVSSAEPPGKSLRDCTLREVILDYVTPEDWALVNRESPQALKWARLERLATSAYAQGVALSLADLGFLLGLSTDAVADCMKEHPKVVLPIRGRVADMGPTLSHAEKIIRLYMDGYTETDIVRRTGHSYESIERYLIDFARVTYCLDLGMPVPAVRMAVGRSRRLVEKYAALYREFTATDDYIFRMARIRRMAEAHPPEKKGAPKEEIQ